MLQIQRLIRRRVMAESLVMAESSGSCVANDRKWYLYTFNQGNDSIRLTSASEFFFSGVPRRIFFMVLRLRLIGAAALAGAALLPMASWAQEQAVPANSDAPPAATPTLETEVLVQPAAASDVTSYSDRAMSISFPKAWEVKAIENGIMIANVTTVSTELVATQVVSIDAPPGAVVNANIDSFVEEGATVGRYRTVTIDAQSALVIWLSNRPDELSSAIATFIGYGNKTILLFSRYAPENETAEERILQMHTSFANLAIQTAAVEEP